jgi:hypothetical protein
MPSGNALMYAMMLIQQAKLFTVDTPPTPPALLI